MVKRGLTWTSVWIRLSAVIPIRPSRAISVAIQCKRCARFSWRADCEEKSRGLKRWDETLWRYIDFADLVAMLEYQRLFFTTPARLGDPFEGALDVGTKNRLLAKEDPKALKAFVACLKQVVFVSCSHANDVASAAMWQLYSIHQLGLALRSTAQKLKNALEEPKVRIAPMRYIDYFDEREAKVPGTEDLYFLKRKGFEYEREVRAFLYDSADIERCGRGETVEPRRERWVRARLDVLIDEIVLSPESQDWLEELVVRVLRRYGLEKPVRRSELLRAPPLAG